MLTEVKEYRCSNTPSDEDINEALTLSKTMNCVIKISWFVKYNGEYARFVRPDNTFEEIKQTLPKTYGI